MNTKLKQDQRKKNQGNTKSSQSRAPTSTNIPAVSQSITHYNGGLPLRLPPAIECKFLDTSITTALSAVTTILSVTPVPQGDTVSSRDGAKIRLHSLVANFILSFLTATVAAATRIIYVQYTPDSSGGTPSATDILQTNSITSFYAFTPASTFRILQDKTYYQTGLVTDPTPSSYQGATGEVIPISSAFPNLSYTGATTGTNQIFILMITNAAVNFPTITGTVRLTYLD